MDTNTSGDDVRSSATSSQKRTYWQRVRAILCSGLSPVERLVLVAIADHVNDSGSCWPSKRRLSDLTGYSERTVQRSLSSLADRDVLQRLERPGRSTLYQIDWQTLEGGDTVSPPQDTVSPLGSQNVSPPRTQCLPTQDTVSPEDSKEDNKEDRPEKTDGLLTLSELISIPVGDTLSAVDGYREAWAAWAAVRPGTQWRTVASVEALHAEMGRAWLDGRDVVRALEQAAQKRYRMIRVGWMARRATSSTTTDRPSTATPTPEQAWQRVDAALLRFGAHPPWLEDGWYFSEQPSIDAAYRAGVLAAAEITDGDTAQAWAVLYAGGNDQSILWQSRRFSNAFKKSIRGAA